MSFLIPKYNFIILPLFICFPTSNAFAQSGWIQQNSGVISNLYSVKFVSSNTGICVGDHGVILQTTNGGLEWIQQSSGFLSNLRSLAATSSFAAYAVGDSGLILKSTDGGITWFRLSLQPYYNFSSVFFINDSLGYTGGVRMDFKSENKLFKTFDGGITWDSIASKDVFSFIKSIFFINSNIGWSTKGYIALSSEGIEKTTNGGVNWSLQFDRMPPISSVFFIDTLNGWVGARAEFSVHSILRTSNGGGNWTGHFLGIQTNSLYFITGNIGWSASNERTIFATTNGGKDWINQTSQKSGVNYNSVYFTDSLTGWVVGDSGKILKTTTGGVLTNFSNTSTEFPREIFLSQNYPNPFNPITNISYELQVTSYVSLKVFDVIGHEVAALINQKQNSGRYEVEFDGSNLASGLYFYTLKSGNFNETKRMLLLK